MSDSTHHQKKIRVRQRSKKHDPRIARTNYFVDLFYYDRRFRLSLGCGLLLALIVGVILPKIWISSPPHLEEPIRVSILDLVQNRVLKHSAQALLKEGKMSEAVGAWTAAIANNRADVQAYRSLPEILAEDPKPSRKYLGLAYGHSSFLLKLTQTNRMDVALSSRILLAYGLYPQVIKWVSASPSESEPESVENRLVALFETDQMEEFGRIWASDSRRLSTRSLASLYAAAWAAGWGPRAVAGEARADVEKAAAAGNKRRQALQLLLTLHYSRLDIVSYESTLSQLETIAEARVIDSVRLWILLDQSGHRTRAIELAGGYSVQAETGAEAELLIQTWRRLGLTSLALEYARKQVANFDYCPGLWTAFASLLIEAKNWDELQRMATSVREGGLNIGYTAWVSFLEGLVDHYQNRATSATNQFFASATNAFSNPLLGFSSAATMRQLGYPTPATLLLQNLQGQFTNSLIFWASLQSAAYEGRNADAILEASEQLYLLQPTYAIAANNFAVALLTQRVRLDDTLEITQNLFAQYPDSAAVRINQASALIRSRRLDEALPVLQGLKALTMGESEQSFAQLAWFEYHDARESIDEALTVADQIEKRFLFEGQKVWLLTRMTALKARNRNHLKQVNLWHLFKDTEFQTFPMLVYWV